jgi:hypothetical protein
MSFFGEEFKLHHFLVILLIVFIGVSLVRRNTLGVPSMVDSLVGSVTAPLGNLGIGTAT